MSILLIHGALGCGTQLRPLADRLPDATCIELTGHGTSMVPAVGLSYERFLDDIHAATEGKGRVHLFGYSMGGYAAAVYAAKHPDRVVSVATLGSKLIWDEAGLKALMQRLNADAIQQYVPQYAQRLARDHGEPRWRELVKATAELVTRDFHAPMLTDEAFAAVQCPVLVCSGDRDDMALAPDTLKAAARFADGGALILPRTKHPFDLVDLDLLVPHLQHFWSA